MVTLNNKEIFTIVPKQKELSNRWNSYFGILPPDAATDDDIDREER